MATAFAYDPDAIALAKRINMMEAFGGPRADAFFGRKGEQVVWLRNRNEALCADEAQRNGHELKPGEWVVIENGGWRVEGASA